MLGRGPQGRRGPPGREQPRRVVAVRQGAQGGHGDVEDHAAVAPGSHEQGQGRQEERGLVHGDAGDPRLLGAGSSS